MECRFCCSGSSRVSVGKFWAVPLALDTRFSKRGGRLEEHVRELRPRNRSEQHRRRDEIESQKNTVAKRGRPSAARSSPDQTESHAQDERDDEQVGAHETERRVALGGDIDADEEPEPVAADADHQSADVPQGR